MVSVQKKELSVLKEVIKLLEVNGLSYCAVSGTCLGAIRHKGFIPWDDDIDIAMPRKDYELFRTEIFKQLPEPYMKMDGDVSESHDFLFMKIHDSMTTQIEDYAKDSPDRITGAFVDIFPLDGVPNCAWKRRIWHFVYYILAELNYLRRKNAAEVKDFKSFVCENIAWFCKKMFRYNFFSEALTRFVLKCDVDCCNKVSNAAFHWKLILDHVYDKRYFFDTVQCEFEDIFVSIPREYNKYLTETYGEYMKLPDESERKSHHHVYISDMNTPCSVYANEIQERLKNKN